jgi:hypothetical protein
MPLGLGPFLDQIVTLLLLIGAVLGGIHLYKRNVNPPSPAGAQGCTAPSPGNAPPHAAVPPARFPSAAMKNEPECYGKMFPPVISLVPNEPVAGMVFGYQIDHPGIAVTRRVVTTNREAWRHCLECPHFDGCYRLSAGTTLMEIAVRP